MATKPVGLRDVVHGRKHSRLRLLAPLRYLSIVHPEKSIYDVKVPVVVAAVAWLLYLIVEPNLRLFGDGGLLPIIRNMLMMAVPFLFGALAAVSMANPGDYFNKRPRGPALLLDGVTLTLRQFVCYMLGYLTLLSLVTLGCVTAAELLRPSIIGWVGVSSDYLHWVRAGGALLLSILCSSLATTTLWALYFLTDVVNHPDAEPADRG